MNVEVLSHLFEVDNYAITKNGFRSGIKLNAEHIVYSGHFPGQPVTPGVIQLYIVHTLLETHYAKKIQLKTISQCKFLKTLNPVEDSYLVVDVNVEINEELLFVNASGANQTDVFFKLNATYSLT